MVLSRGLIISLGVSALGCTLLFLYFTRLDLTILREVSQFKLPLLSVANLTPPPPTTFSEKNCGKWRVIRVFSQFFTADFTAA